MTWTGNSFSFGQILTSTQMQQVQDDITALANGDAGAPSIVVGALESNLRPRDLIEEVSMSATTHTFATVSGYDRYRIEYEFTAGGAILGMRVGNTTVATGFSYEHAGVYAKASSSTAFVIRDSSNDFMYIGPVGIDACGHVDIMGANQTGSYCYTKAQCSVLISGEIFDYSVSSCFRTKNNANAFQIGNYGLGSSTMAGTARLYGYRN